MVFLAMKTPPSCSPHSTVLAHLAKHPWGLRAPSLALLAALILALIGREDVRLTKLAAQLPGKALQCSKVKQLHRFFKNIRLPEDVLAHFVLSFSNPADRLWLVIDRTFLGRTDALEHACPQLAFGKDGDQYPAGGGDPERAGPLSHAGPAIRYGRPCARRSLPPTA